MSRAWFALAVVGVLGLFYVVAGLNGGSLDGLAYGQAAVPIQPLFPKPAVRRVGLSFHYIGSQSNTEIYRAKITGGWLISAGDNANRTGLSVAFVPDADHKWDGNSLP